MMEYNSHIWANASRSILEDWKLAFPVKALIGDIGLSNKLDSLEHRRNMGCISLFHYNRMCSAEIREFVPNTHSFIGNTRSSRRAYLFVTDWSITTHYRKKSFFCRIVDVWNKLPSEVFPDTSNLKDLSLMFTNNTPSILHPISYFLSTNTMPCINKDHLLSAGSIKKNESIKILVFTDVDNFLINYSIQFSHECVNETKCKYWQRSPHYSLINSIL